jgi:uncharacterized phage protein (predicted DNA packaging)
MADTLLITLDEAKEYLRIDHDDEDELLINLIKAAEWLVIDVGRLSASEYLEDKRKTRVATLYALAYMYEHREEADYHALTLDLRSLLLGIRKQVF